MKVFKGADGLWKVKIGEEVGTLLNHLPEIQRRLDSYGRLLKERNNAEVRVKQLEHIINGSPEIYIKNNKIEYGAKKY